MRQPMQQLSMFNARPVINNPMVVVPSGFDPFDPNLDSPLTADMIDVINSTKGRSVAVASPSLNEYLESKGFDIDAYQHFQLNSICGQLFKGAGDFTISRSNKLALEKNRVSEFESRLQELTAEYKDLDESGMVKHYHRSFEINLARLQDRAFIRVRHRCVTRKMNRKLQTA